jgi:hypothetical protein
MKHNKFKTIANKSMLILVIFLIFFACKDENSTDPVDNKPEMPPISSMQMDFDSFPESETLSKITGNNSWGWAWLHGVAWKTVISAGMVIPVAAFAESFNHEPVQQEDGRWLWEYNFAPFGGANHTASLYGSVDNDGINWEMYISKESQFADFLWFSGESDIFGTEGTWTFYDNPNNPSTLFGIEWQRNKEESTGSIKFTNIIPDHNENGGYINYGVVSDPIYDAFFEIYNKKEENYIYIKWNRETHQGRVQDAKHFGDSEWRCWDESLQDVVCE